MSKYDIISVLLCFYSCACGMLADLSNFSNALFSPTLHRALQNEQAHSKTNAEGFISQQDDLKDEIAEKDETIAKLKSALKASKEEKKEMEEHLAEKIE